MKNEITNYCEIRNLSSEEELTESEIFAAKVIMKSFDLISFKTGLWGTNEVEMFVDTGESKPFKHRREIIKLMNYQLVINYS